MNAHQKTRVRFALMAVVICGMLIVVAPVAYALPPRPTPAPGGPGASIELRVQAGYVYLSHWQDLWTVVQWQDAHGDWHDVEGWRGSLDEIVQGEGQKVWWVYQRDLNKGPFRWVVYEHVGGKRLASSEPFNLPQAPGQTTVTSVTLVDAR